LWVVRPAVAPYLGGALAVPVFLLGLVRRDRLPWLTGVLVAGLTLGGVALLWLPEPLAALALGPTLAAAAAVVIRHWSFGGEKAGDTSLPAGQPVAVVAVLAALLAAPGRAAAPAPATVYLVPAEAGAAEPWTVLAPPDL